MMIRPCWRRDPDLARALRVRECREVVREEVRANVVCAGSGNGLDASDEGSVDRGVGPAENEIARKVGERLEALDWKIFVVKGRVFLEELFRLVKLSVQISFSDKGKVGHLLHSWEPPAFGFIISVHTCAQADLIRRWVILEVRHEGKDLIVRRDLARGEQRFGNHWGHSTSTRTLDKKTAYATDKL